MVMVITKNLKRPTIVQFTYQSSFFLTFSYHAGVQTHRYWPQPQGSAFRGGSKHRRQTSGGQYSLQHAHRTVLLRQHPRCDAGTDEGSCPRQTWGVSDIFFVLLHTHKQIRILTYSHTVTYISTGHIYRRTFNHQKEMPVLLSVHLLTRVPPVATPSAPSVTPLVWCIPICLVPSKSSGSHYTTRYMGLCITPACRNDISHEVQSDLLLKVHSSLKYVILLVQVCALRQCYPAEQVSAKILQKFLITLWECLMIAHYCVVSVCKQSLKTELLAW